VKRAATLVAWQAAFAGARRLLCLALAAVTCGCHSLSTFAPDGTKVRHYFGYVQVVVPDAHVPGGGVSSSDISGAGLRIEDGLLFGLFRDKTLALPVGCHFVMLVHNREQLDRALNALLARVSREDVCLAVQSQ
jgi:hypothetical protein